MDFRQICNSICSVMKGKQREHRSAALPSPTSTSLQLESKIETVAIAIVCEAHDANTQEQIAIGFACLRNSKYSCNKINSKKFLIPSEPFRKLAKMIVTGGLSDPTNGANAWYSPRKFMIQKEKQISNEEEEDICDCLEKTHGLNFPNRRPSWSVNAIPIRIEGVRDEMFKFYRL